MTLDLLPKYGEYVQNARLIKEVIVYKFQWRQTIPYTLTCPTSIQDSLSAMKDVNSTEGKGNVFKAIWITLCSDLGLTFIYVIFSIICFLKGQSCFTHCCFKVVQWISVIVQLVFCIAIITLASIAYSSVSDQKSALDRLKDSVNGCSDDYTRVPDASASDVANWKAKALWVLILILIALILQLLSLLGFITVSCMKNTKPQR